MWQFDVHRHAHRRTLTLTPRPQTSHHFCSIASIIPVLEQVLKTQRPLLIISEDVESGGCMVPLWCG